MKKLVEGSKVMVAFEKLDCVDAPSLVGCVITNESWNPNVFLVKSTDMKYIGIAKRKPSGGLVCSHAYSVTDTSEQVHQMYIGMPASYANEGFGAYFIDSLKNYRRSLAC